MKVLRTVLSCMGAVYDIVIPPRIAQTAAASVAAAGPAEVSADPTPVPSAGHLLSFADYTTAEAFTAAANILEDTERGFGELYLDARQFDLRGFIADLHGRAAAFEAVTRPLPHLKK